MSKLVKVQNLKKKPAAADKYNHIYVTMPSGYTQHLLFTDKDIERAIERAAKNTEDLPMIGWIRELFT